MSDVRFIASLVGAAGLLAVLLWLLWAWIIGAVLVMDGLFAVAWAVRWLLAGTRVDRTAEYLARGGYGRP